MKQFRLFLGLSDKDTKTQLLDETKAMQYIVKTFGGGTFSKSQGAYTHENGSLVIENTLIIDIITNNENLINQSIAYLKDTYNQETILKCTFIGTAKFE